MTNPLAKTIARGGATAVIAFPRDQVPPSASQDPIQ
jgi:hypothetical protein